MRRAILSLTDLTASRRMTLTLFAACLVGVALIMGLGIRTAETQTSPAPTTYYEVQDLGSLGGRTMPYGINTSGQVVGYSETQSGEWHAFLYDESATPKMQDLGTLGGSNSYAMGINDSGQVVGYSETATSGEEHAFLYDSTNGMKDLGTLGGNSYADDINNSGQVVGTSYTASGDPHPFIWKDDGDDTTSDMKDPSVPEGIWIGTWPWGSYSYAEGINDSGQVVGQTSNHAFLYDSATKKVKDLGVLGYCCSSDAYGINASGQVVGYSYDSSGEWHAFLYSGGSMQDLGSLGLQNAIPQNGVNWADDINDSGQIVGYSEHGNFNDAFLYQNGQMIDLSTRLLPEDRDVWKLEEGTSINNDGQIVVAGLPYTGAEIDFTEHALLLTPSDTPPSDTTPPDTTISSQPEKSTNSTSASFSFTSDETSATFECSNDNQTWASCTSPYSYSSIALQDGSYNFYVRAKDAAGNVDETPASYTWTVDLTAPTVSTTTPASNATGVKRNTNLTATFSEKMAPASITKSTFKLYKCSSTTSTTCTTEVTNVNVTLSTDGLKATLDPFGTSSTLLGSKTKYKALVTTGAKDVAGNALDQSPSTTGNQQKEWYFTTGSG